MARIIKIAGTSVNIPVLKKATIQPEVEEDITEPDMVPEKPLEDETLDSIKFRCLCCGIPVVQNPGRKEKKFCSDRCRAKWWNTHPELSENRTWQDIECLNCGRVFKVYGKTPRKYCCHACYVRHRFGDNE